MADPDDVHALAAELREFIELDRAFGVEFVARAPASAAPARPVPAPSAAAPRPATALVGYAARSAPAAPPSPPSPALAPAAPAPGPGSTAGGGAGLAATALEQIVREVSACAACGLCPTRTTTVPGEGSPAAELVFVGEGPGEDEDRQGRPFVGRAGELLTRMIAAMGFRRDEVYICNVVKCRPPGNRTPAPEEIAACLPYLERQLLAIRPKVICSLGNTPLRALTGDPSLGITRLRGQRLDWRGIPLIPTFHPAYLLRNEQAKKPCWDDLRAVLALLGRQPPARG